MSYGEVGQLIGLSSGGGGDAAPDLLFRVLLLPSSQQSPGLNVFVSALRSISPTMCLRFNREGVFWRTTLGSYSHEVFFAPTDYFIAYSFREAQPGAFVELNFLTHDLDAILNKTTVSSGAGSGDGASGGAGKSADRIVEMLMYSSDRTRVTINSYAPNLCDTDYLNLTLPTSPYESGAMAPPECSYNVVGRQVAAYTPLVQPRDLLRCVRAHSKFNKYIGIKLGLGGAVHVVSEQCGTMKRSILSSLPYTNNNAFFFTELKEDDATYGSELLIGVLRACQHLDRAHFLVSQGAELNAPLVFAASLGHLSYARFYIMPCGQLYTPCPTPDDNKENLY